MSLSHPFLTQLGSVHPSEQWQLSPGLRRGWATSAQTVIFLSRGEKVVSARYCCSCQFRPVLRGVGAPFSPLFHESNSETGVKEAHNPHVNGIKTVRKVRNTLQRRNWQKVTTLSTLTSLIGDLPRVGSSLLTLIPLLNPGNTSHPGDKPPLNPR